MSNDFTSLDPFNDRLVSIQVLRAVFTILISILFLNSLIALLNLRVEAADKKVSFCLSFLVPIVTVGY